MHQLPQVAATGNVNPKRSEADNIWVELGRTRRHIVQLQDSLMPMSPEQWIEAPPTPCLETLCMYWPHFEDSSSHGSAEEMYRQCMVYYCCLALHPNCLLGWPPKGVHFSNLTYLDTSVNLTGAVKLCQHDTQGTNKTRALPAAGCASIECGVGYAVEHGLPELEYGWGLFHVTDSHPHTPHNPSQPVVCPPGGGETSNEHEFVGHAHNWFHRNRYEHEPTLFVILSYLVMLVVSFNEVRQALHLLIYSAAKAGSLPHFFTPDQLQQGKIPGRHAGDLSRWSEWFILVVPVLQLLVSFVLMSCGGALLLITELQSNRASIIFNAVAWAFVVEMDDRVGLIMKMQQPWMRTRNYAGANAVCAAAAATNAQRRPSAGYVVFGLVGWLLLSHSLLVAPQTPAQMLAFFTITWAYISNGRSPMGVEVLQNFTSDDAYRDGMTYNLFKDPRVRAIDYIDANASVWNTFAFMGFAGLANRLSSGPDELINREGAIWLCSVYLLVAVVMVLLLCHSLLPCQAAHWRWVLTAVQVLLVVVANLQYLTAYKWEAESINAEGWWHWVRVPRNSSIAAAGSEPMAVQKYGFVSVLVTLFASWLTMFVLWPFIYWGHHSHWAFVTDMYAAAHERWVGLRRTIKTWMCCGCFNSWHRLLHNSEDQCDTTSVAAVGGLEASRTPGDAV